MARRETRSLRVDLTEEQRQARSLQMAGDYLAVDKAEAALEEFKESMKAAVKARTSAVERMRGAVSAMARDINNGYITTAVECQWHSVLAEGEAGFKVLVRCDTGEAVERLPLTVQERQLVIGGQLEEATPEQVARWRMELAALGQPEEDESPGEDGGEAGGEPDDFGEDGDDEPEEDDEEDDHL